jgi:predicted nucleic acid-binding protein
VIVLDTNVISEIFRPHPDARVVAWLETLTGDVAITAVTLAELLAGVRSIPAGKRKTVLGARIDAAIQPYRETKAILAFDDVAADHYAGIFIARKTAGLPTHAADAQIAAICRAHGAVCATRNTKDYAETGVELIDPWAA